VLRGSPCRRLLRQAPLSPPQTLRLSSTPPSGSCPPAECTQATHKTHWYCHSLKKMVLHRQCQPSETTTNAPDWIDAGTAPTKRLASALHYVSGCALAQSQPSCIICQGALSARASLVALRVRVRSRPEPAELHYVSGRALGQSQPSCSIGRFREGQRGLSMGLTRRRSPRTARSTSANLKLLRFAACATASDLTASSSRNSSAARATVRRPSPETRACQRRTEAQRLDGRIHSAEAARTTSLK
jgi:hypothetical protein